MHQLSGCGDDSRAHAFQVIGTYLYAYSTLCFGVEQQPRTHAAQRFCQGRRSTTVQQTHGLVCASIYGHCRTEPALCVDMETDAQVCDERFGPKDVRPFGVGGVKKHGCQR